MGGGVGSGGEGGLFRRQRPGRVSQVSSGLLESRRARRELPRLTPAPPKWAGTRDWAVWWPAARLDCPAIRACLGVFRGGCLPPPGGRFYIASPRRSVGDIGKGWHLVAVPELQFREAGDTRGSLRFSLECRGAIGSWEIEPLVFWGTSGALASSSSSSSSSSSLSRRGVRGCLEGWTSTPRVPPPPPLAERERVCVCGTRTPLGVRLWPVVRPSVSRVSCVTLGWLGTGVSLAGKPVDGAMVPSAGTRGVLVVAPDFLTKFSEALCVGGDRMGPDGIRPDQAAQRGEARAATSVEVRPSGGASTGPPPLPVPAGSQ